MAKTADLTVNVSNDLLAALHMFPLYAPRKAPNELYVRQSPYSGMHKDEFERHVKDALGQNFGKVKFKIMTYFGGGSAHAGGFISYAVRITFADPAVRKHVRKGINDAHLTYIRK